MSKYTIIKAKKEYQAAIHPERKQCKVDNYRMEERNMNAIKNAEVMIMLEQLLLQFESQLGNAHIYNDVPDATIDDIKLLITKTKAEIDKHLVEWHHTDMYNAQYDEHPIDEDPVPHFTELPDEKPHCCICGKPMTLQELWVNGTDICLPCSYK
jgi:hypothetical protein